VGSNVVYVRDGHEVVKLYCPLFARDHRIEGAVMEHVHGRVGVDTPEILHRGELEGWPYIITSFVSGMPLQDLWPQLNRDARVSISHQIGELIARWHTILPDGLDASFENWPEFIQKQIDTSADRQRDQGLSEAWVSRLDDYMNSFEVTDFVPSHPVLVNADFIDEHILLTGQSGDWAITGLIDFGDVMAGHREYDLIAPTIEIMAGERECQIALLKSYGYRDDDINDELRKRLMAWSLLHRFADVPYMLRKVSAASSPQTVEELARAVWRFLAD
jgi:hygromycin-B 7''-O-kinase